MPEGRPQDMKTLTPRIRKKTPFARLLSLLGLLALLGVGFVAWEGWRFLETPGQTPGKSVVINIEPGAGLRGVANLLEAEGIITNSQNFVILARVQQKEQHIQAGRFLMNTGWKPQEVLTHLVSGLTMLYRVTIPEGRAWWEVGKILEQAGMCRAEDFATVIHDPAFLTHWGIPFDSAEGFLYPDTYFLQHPTEIDEKAARATANRLLDAFWSKADALWPNGRPGNQTLKETIILASIIEKETGLPEERARVAGVYANRLKKNMLLQADPTVIYGMGPNFRGPLLTRHLEDTSNPYNTYRKAGLPPGPICSPGQAAIRAALAPEEHNYLYFVASGTGRSHVFSTNLQQHNQAVQAYRRAIRGQ